MKVIIPRFILAIFVATVSFGEVIYVSPAGQASWSGRSPGPNVEKTDGPLPTLAAARDKIRALRKAGNTGPFQVEIGKGVYVLDQTLTLTPLDSDVTYLSRKGDHPVISGGRRITGWKPTGTAHWSASLTGAATQLFVTAVRLQPSRLPVDGFYRGDGYSSRDNSFHFRGADINPEWANSGVAVVSLHDWSMARRPLAAVDPTARVARLVNPGTVPPEDRDVRYWLENVPGPQASGEWYYDSAKGMISVWTDKDLSAEEVDIPQVETLISLQGRPGAGNQVNNVIFKGVTFEYSSWSLPTNGFVDNQAAAEVPAAVTAKYASHLVLDHCTFSHLGGYGVWFGRGSKQNILSHSEVSDAGAGGIKIGETGNEDGIDSNTVSDNELHDLGQVYPSAVGVWLARGSNNIITHNDLHDLTYSGISVGWTWGYKPTTSHNNTVSYNSIHEVGKGVMSDMGGIYTLGAQPGTTIDHNLIHDVLAYEYGGWGLYQDEGSSNIRIENNIVYRTSTASVHENYGENNAYSNNIFAFGQQYQVMLSKSEPHISMILENNVIVYASGGLFKGFQEKSGIVADRNDYWSSNGTLELIGTTWNDWQKTGHDAHSIVSDPLFVNASAYNFSLRKDSPTIALGFKPIDFSGVGPREEAGANAFVGPE